jgi:hypothetical protein
MPRQVYALVFDAANEPLPWNVLVLGLTLVGVGVVLWMTRHRPPLWPPRSLWSNPGARKWFASLWLAFAVLWTAAGSIAAFRSVLSARSALRDRTTSVVEGPVEDFHPMPYAGHDTERFTVQGVSFEYSDFAETTGGFHHTRSHGGPISGGVFVRIHYDGSPRHARILRLEVRQ